MRGRREPARRPVANDGAFVGDERGGRDQRERRERGEEVKKVEEVEGRATEEQEKLIARFTERSEIRENSSSSELHKHMTLFMCKTFRRRRHTISIEQLRIKIITYRGKRLITERKGKVSLSPKRRPSNKNKQAIMA